MGVGTSLELLLMGNCHPPGGCLMTDCIIRYKVPGVGEVRVVLIKRGISIGSYLGVWS